MVLFLSMSNGVRLFLRCRDHAPGFPLPMWFALPLFFSGALVALAESHGDPILPKPKSHAGPLWRRPPP